MLWIDAGIDSGHLVATERTLLQGTDNLMELHVKVMDHAHALLVRCAERLVASERLPNVPQSAIAQAASS